MGENENKQSFEVDELDNKALEEAAGGGMFDINYCPVTNSVAGCGGDSAPKDG